MVRYDSQSLTRGIKELNPKSATIALIVNTKSFEIDGLLVNSRCESPLLDALCHP